MTSTEYETMPLAIVGMACRFAGGVSSPEKLWDFVASGQDAWSTIPDTRFNIEAFYHSRPDNVATGWADTTGLKTNIRGGYFLQEDVGLFDPSFFGLSADMAAAMDPQIRTLLELAFESLESAGIPLQDISGSKTSVFTGTFIKDYHEELLSDPLRLPRHLILGNYSAMAANRISHFLNLKGPSAAIDTGCSTSIMGLHLACQSLRSRETDCAIVGGANLLLGPDSFVNLSNLGSCGPEGKCYSFDHRAQGYGRGEGAAILVVKRLDDALRDHDPIRALIRETAVNQDGKTATIAAPDADAQYDLIRACYERACLNPLDTLVVEAHGTGTKVGDPIEASAIGRAFRPQVRTGAMQKTNAPPVYLASVKTNIGHTESASGVAAVIKMVKSLETGQIAPSINFEKVNPDIDVETLGLKVVTELKPWPQNQVWRASVNNFGYGGTNAHIILEKAPRAAQARSLTETGSSLTAENTPKLVVLSARTESALRRVASNLCSHLTSEEGRYSLESLAYTLGQRRSRFPWTITLSAHSVRDLVDSLAEDDKIRPVQAPSQNPRLGFVFNGQGAQWFGMGRQLMDVYPVYLRTLEECDEAIKRYGAEWSVVEELKRGKDQSRVDQVQFSMPLSCAVQLGLIRLLDEWGVQPVAVAGHSTGEVAAAFAAGALSLDEAMAVTFFRGLLNAREIEAQASQGRSGLGGMMAVGLGHVEVSPYLQERDASGRPGQVTVACFNSPSSVTLSGDMSAIEELKQVFDHKQVFARKLKVQAAFHSHHMRVLADAYGAALEKTMGSSERSFNGRVDFFSTCTGAVIKDARQLGPSYWVQNMVEPVQFAQAFSNMIVAMDANAADDSQPRSNVDFVVEIGAHGALAGPIRQLLSQPTMKELGVVYGSCLDRGEDAVRTAQNLAGRLLQHGYTVDIARVNCGNADRDSAAGLLAIPDLPSYPWNHATSFWAEPRPSRVHRFRKHAPHELIGTRLPIVSDQSPVWRNVLRCSDLPWLRDHVVQSQVVFPGAGYITMAIEAMRQEVAADIAGGDADERQKVIRGYRLRDVDLCKAIIVPQDAATADEGVEVQISLELPDERALVQEWRRFRICAAFDKTSPWELVASGLISVEWVEWESGSSTTEKAKTGSLDSVPSLLEKQTRFALRSTASTLGVVPSHPSGYRRRIKPKDLFKALRGNGIRHGPLFQNLSGDILLGEGKCLTTITVADPDQNGMGTHPVTPIHPVTLDAVCVGAYASRHASSGSLKEATTAIPKSIKSLYVSSEIASDPGRKLEAHFATRYHSKGGFGVSAAVYNSETVGQGLGPVLEIEDLRCQSVGAGLVSHDDDDEGEGKGALKSKEQLCLVTDWKRSFRLNDPAPLAQSLSLQAAARPDIQKQVEEEKGLDRDLQRAAYYCISDTLKQLSDEDMSRLQWHHKRLHDWMLLLEKQAAGNELGPRSSRWASSSEGAKQMLIDKVDKASVTGALAMRIGKNLLPIMQGHTAPLELMLQDKLLYTFYQNCLHFPRATQHAASLVQSMAEENPRLRILEIGAGTGGCTLPVLLALGGGDGGSSDSLPLFEHYTFTDISAGFFEVARQKLAAWDGSISYASLNIEEDTAEQGFQAGSYDVIIAAQVLHATKNIKKTMENVRGLLKDGGKLVLVETIRDTAYLHMIFGTLPGWWLSEEPERQHNPNMSVEAWDKTLRETRFTGVEANAWDCEDPDHRALACIVSSAAVAPAAPSLLSKTATLVYEDAPPADWVRTLGERFSCELNVALAAEALSPAFVPDGKLCLFVSGVGGQTQRWPFEESLFGSVKALVTRSKGVLWITTGSAAECEVPENALHQGLLRTARLEDAGRRYVSLDLDPHKSPWDQSEFVLKVFRTTMSDQQATDDLDFEYAVRNSELFVPRICPDAREHDELMAGLEENKPEMQPFVSAGRSLRMVVDTPGLVDSIVFREDPEAGLPLPDDWIEVEPRAYGLNFHDVMTVMGMLQHDVQEIGSECAGVVTRVGRRSPNAEAGKGKGTGTNMLQVGDRVCGLLAHGHFANRVRVPWTWMAKIPASVPFETAASFPLVFVTAYHSLFDAGRCAPEDTVLIHAASGGVGQACIILALWKGTPVQNILVTAGTREKREFLVAEYGLLPSNVFSSRDDSFVGGVLAATGGRGVDVVINSLSGKLLHETFHLVAPLGRFIEIGKRDIDANKSIEMEPFQKAISFSHVDIIALCDRKGALIQRVLREVISLVASGVVRNVTPVTTTPLRDIVQTFRTMQTGKHTGKLVLAVAPDEVVKTTQPPKAARLRPDSTYMIVGGVSGIGLSVANYLLDRGARTLLLVSRNAVRRSDTPPFREVQQKADLCGATLVVRDSDVGEPDAMRLLVKDCRDAGLPAIRGVVHGGMVLDDAIIEHMAFTQWQRALAPKLYGTRNIVEALGDEVDFMVVLSSLCGVWGNPSQANYAAGNAYQDAVARNRSSRGRPAVTIDLGAVESVGYVANAQDVDVGERLLRNSGHRSLTEAEALGLVDYAIRRPRRAAARVSQIASGMSGAGAYALRDPRFSIMVRQAASDARRAGAGGPGGGGGGGAGAASGPVSMHEHILTAGSPTEAAGCVQSALVARLSDMFAIPETDIDPRKPLAHFGVDSLVAVELRNWIVPNARVEMTIFELLKSPSLSELAAKVVKLARPIF